jgi:hypothetical protein
MGLVILEELTPMLQDELHKAIPNRIFVTLQRPGRFVWPTLPKREKQTTLSHIFMARSCHIRL